MNRKFRVAIFQNTITGGGRIQVVNEIISILNEFEIVPDFYTLRVNTSFKKKENIHFNIVKIPQYIRGFYELKIVHLNWLMRSRSKKYDLLINSNNSLLFAPKDIPTITYVYFPREMRILTDYVSWAFPDGPLVKEKNLEYQIYRKFLQYLYSFRKYTRNNLIIADSNFTKQIFLKAYPECNQESVKIIYPPVDVGNLHSNIEKKTNTITTLGRFNIEKRQLEQIQIAEDLPDLHFNIIGFVGDADSKNYYEHCQNYIQDKTIKNVTLYKNLPQEDAKRILQESQFFMHNLRNEPFGLSTVEAIAAGCIPIVTNSGGQVEIVPIEELRFDTKAEVLARLKSINKLNFETIQKKLKSHILQYGLYKFQKEIKTVIIDCITKSEKLRL